MIWVLGISFEVRGQEYIRKNHGGVVLMNHQSLLDMSGKPICVFLFEIVRKSYWLDVIVHLFGEFLSQSKI